MMPTHVIFAWHDHLKWSYARQNCSSLIGSPIVPNLWAEKFTTRKPIQTWQHILTCVKWWSSCIIVCYRNFSLANSFYRKCCWEELFRPVSCWGQELQNVLKSEFKSSLWFSSCLEDFERQFVRTSNVSLLWLITETCSPTGHLQLLVGYRNHSLLQLSVGPLLCSLQETHLKHESLFDSVCHPLDGESSSNLVSTNEGQQILMSFCCLTQWEGSR